LIFPGGSGGSAILSSGGSGDSSSGGSVASGVAGEVALYGSTTEVVGSASIPSAITATTQAAGTDNTQIATTAFVQTAIGPVPAVQKSLYAQDTNTTQSITNPVLVNTLFNVAIYMESYGDGASGSTCVATITWTNVQGNVQTLTLTLLGPSDNIQQENLVVLAKAGTNLIVSTAFGTTSFHYDIGCNVLILPTA
jgi:hypothetical protein